MTINNVITRLVLPVTIIAFGTLTKWWYVLPVDAPDTMMVGFPLAFAADGWWTSMSLQLFLVEMLIDAVVYFLICFLVLLLAKRFAQRIAVSKRQARVVWILAALVVIFWSFDGAIRAVQFKVTRDWDMHVMSTGYKFTWSYKSRPD